MSDLTTQTAPAVPDWLHAYVTTICPQFEQVVLYFYLDTKGLVTIGAGNMVPNVDAALLLPLRHANGMPAKASEINADYRRVAAMKPGMLPHFYFCPTSLALAVADEQQLRLKRCAEFVRELQHEFPGFDTFPRGAKLGLLDMIYNLGLVRLREYRHLYETVKIRSWSAASAVCARDVADEAFARRNAWTRSQFLNAEVGR
jgi:GH24 family phage-related lysozyme (muramidase)